jgi:glycosyltransferase involved in cell wall biosynthesis
MRNAIPAISVIVPAYGVAHLLPEALVSLQAQDFPAWEAIVIDDGAPDDVAGAVAQFGDDSRIRLVQTDNGGLATARNRAIAVSGAPLLALLDGDDLFEPGYLTAMIAAMEAHPEAGFVTCDATNFGTPEREGHPFSRHAPQVGPITLDRVLSRHFNVYIGSVIRRSAFDEVGGFNGALRSAEDLDLWLRLLEAGWQGFHVPQPLGRYRRRAGSLSSNEMNLLRWTEQVYVGALERLGSRPEATTAAAMLDQTRRQMNWIDGEKLIREGRAREGIALLTEAGADGRSLRWRLAMPVMRRVPWLAPALIQIRAWLPPLFPFASGW